MLKRMRANGGHLTHLKPMDKFTALCGFAPSSPKARKVYRQARWFAVTNNTFRVCGKCAAKAKELNLEIESSEPRP